MNDRLMFEIGTCVFVAQVIENALGSILVLESGKEYSREAFDQEVTQRVGKISAEEYISTLYDKVRRQGVPDHILLGVIEVSNRRNHIVHRLLHDRGMMFDSGHTTLADDIILFVEVQNRLMDYIEKRGLELGRLDLDAPKSTPEMMASHADSILEIVRRLRPDKN